MTKTVTGELSKGDATRRRILEVAETVFAEVGFAAARLDDVAEVVGVRRTTVLHYFNTKQQLYDTAEAGIFRDLQACTEQRVAGVVAPLQRLLAVLDSWLDFFAARPNGARIIMRNTADVEPRAQNPVEFANPTLVAIEDILRAGTAAGVFEPREPMRVVAILGGSILQYVCAAHRLGPARDYRPDDPAQLEPFRALLHLTARALLQPAPGGRRGAK